MSVKPIQRSEIKGFSKGLVTDINPIAGSVDTSSDESNFELHTDGTRSRRLGLDLESGGQYFETGLGWSGVKLSSSNTYLWEGADGNPENKFVVVQLGGVLRFFKQSEEFSNMVLAGQVELPAIPSESKIQFCNVEGYLGIANGSPNIGLIEFNPLTETFSYSSFRITIRDQFGIQETIEPRFENDKQYRGPLNWQHYYNLYNQGWAIPRKDWVYGSPPPVDAVFLGSNKNVGLASPSNSDVLWSGIDQKPDSETSLENFEAFHYRQFEAITGADTVAAKGYFLIDAFNRGSSRLTAWINHKNKYTQTGSLVSGFNPPDDTTSGGPTSLANHAGRIFYSGCRGSITDGDERSPNYNNYVFFSQLIKSKPDFSKCYQEGDPTSRESSDVVDTDGGFFVVSEAINIHSMYSMHDKLFMIAENGVWTVTGGSGYGFSATNYKVERISTFGGIPNRSFVEYGGMGFYWGWDGIYSISRNQMGEVTVENISKDVIDSFYSKIDDMSKMTCQGFVDKVRRQVRWVYTEGTLFEDGVSKELILDLKFNAFYPFTIARHPSNSSYMLSGVQLGDYSTEYVIEDVNSLDQPVVAGTDQVIATISTKVAVDSTVKYLVIRGFGTETFICFCQYSNKNFEDWKFTGDSADASAYIVTNTMTAGDFAIKKQVPYLLMAFAETEKGFNMDGTVNQESSCIGQFMWNFSHMARSNKWGREQQLYRKSRFYYGDQDIDNGFTLNITKTKVRGLGRSFALKINTEPRKACHVYGWSLSLTGNNLA